MALPFPCWKLTGVILPRAGSTSVLFMKAVAVLGTVPGMLSLSDWRMHRWMDVWTDGWVHG